MSLLVQLRNIASLSQDYLTNEINITDPLAKINFSCFTLNIKVFHINFSYNKNIQFNGNDNDSIKKWIALRNALTRSQEDRLETDSIPIDSLPSLNKTHFEYSDFLSLSPKERLILSIISRKVTNRSIYDDGRKYISIKKDAERILEFASKVKEFFDSKYANGYKLVGIGNSPAPIVETIQLLGADAVTLPFSRAPIDACCDSYDFPYKHYVPWYSYYTDSYRGNWERCSAKDWEKYFKFYGVDKDFCKNTGKALIFTDYVDQGWTKKYMETILEGIGFDKNYEFIRTGALLPPNSKYSCDYDLERCLDQGSFKKYARMESPKSYYWEVDILKHPEYIPSLSESIISKLFRCAVYELMEKTTKQECNFAPKFKIAI